jgi:hypothetical protein
VWTPVGVVDDLELAAAIADLVGENEADIEVSVVSADELLHTPSPDRERILDRLNSRTASDIQRDLILRRAAEARLGRHERRSGGDRRSGRDRRSASAKQQRPERRFGRDRRSGRDRRAQPAA